MEEWTQKQGIGEAKNSNEDPQIPEYEICLLAPVGTKSSLLSSSRKGVSRNSVRNSSLDSSNTFFYLTGSQLVQAGRMLHIVSPQPRHILGRNEHCAESLHT